MGLYQTKKCLQSKRNHWQKKRKKRKRKEKRKEKEVTDWMGEDFCKQHFKNAANIQSIQGTHTAQPQESKQSD